MPCPVCRSTGFYLKDPDDPYETTDFTVEDGAPVFAQGEGEAPELTGESQIFCNICSWHGKLDELK